MPRKKSLTEEEPTKTDEVKEEKDNGSEKPVAVAGGYDIRDDEVVERPDEEVSEGEKPKEAESAPSEKPELVRQAQGEQEEEPEDFSFLNKKPKSDSGKKFFWLAVVVLLLVVAVVGGVLIFKDKVNLGGQPTPEPTPEMTPTPQPTPELERNELKIQVLNGSGAPGTAGVAREFLEELGYKIEDTGNAKNYNYEMTQVSLKENKMDYKDILLGDLGEKYEVDQDVGTLDEDSDYDAVIIIGEKKR